MRRLLFLLLLHATFSAAAAAGGGGCSDRRCGSTSVPYPFGFSGNCLILLRCNASASTPLLLTNSNADTPYPITSFNSSASTFVVSVAPSCSRTVREAQASLSGPCYGATSHTGLFLRRGCRSPAASPSCSVPDDVLSGLLQKARCGGNGAAAWTCVSSLPPAPNSTVAAKGEGQFLQWDEVEDAGCEEALTSYAYSPQGLPSVEFGIAELGWWLNGTCANATIAGQCAQNATCYDIETPGGAWGHRCACLGGMSAGDGLRRRGAFQEEDFPHSCRCSGGRGGGRGRASAVPAAQGRALGVGAAGGDAAAVGGGDVERRAGVLVHRDRARHQLLLAHAPPGHGRVRHRVRRQAPGQRQRRDDAGGHQAPALPQPPPPPPRGRGAAAERDQAHLLREPPEPGPPPRLLPRPRRAGARVRVRAQRHALPAPPLLRRRRRRRRRRAQPADVARAFGRGGGDGGRHRVPARHAAAAHLPPRRQVQQHPPGRRAPPEAGRLRPVPRRGPPGGRALARLHRAAGHARVRGPGVPPELPPLRQERRVQLRSASCCWSSSPP